MQYLRQSTAVKAPHGPLVDQADGFTPETAVTLNSGEAFVLKQDGAAGVDISARTWTHIDEGVYNLSLSASDTDTCGMLTVLINRTGTARPVKQTYMVIPANVYDSVILGTDYLLADAYQISGNTTAGTNLSAAALGIVTATVGTGSTTTTVKTGLSEVTNAHYHGRICVFTTGTRAGQAATISDYTGSTGTLTVTALTEAPTNGDLLVIV